MSELKSCPFCGGEARPMYAVDEDTKQITYTVMCMSCNTAIFHPRMSVFEWDAYDTEAEADAAWNTRHVETCTVERNESGCNFAYRLYTLSCGHTVWTMGDAPNYCQTCGKKVEQ